MSSNVLYVLYRTDRTSPYRDVRMSGFPVSGLDGDTMTKIILGDREVAATEPRPPWHKTHGTYLAGRAAIDHADAVAIEAEKRWGVGRLRLLADDVLREKFDRQRYLFNQAIWFGDLEDVKREAGRMVAAFRVLTEKAEDAFHRPLQPEWWEVGLADGSVAVICRSNPEAHDMVREGRKTRVFTLAEIGRLIEAFPAIAKAKETFPGATVTAWRKTDVDDPLDAVHDTRASLDDEIPF